MRLVRDVRLTTPEVIRCIEHGVREICREDEIVERVYGDDYMTDANIADEMHGSPIRREVGEEIANLYLNGEIYFDKLNL